MEMDSRKQKILEAVVLDYIETAEPVGSRTISKKYDLGVSSATIRNEMADLEEMGYIEQPHTSAGRVPSDKGYRYYVDYLMTKDTIREEARSYISQAICNKTKQVEDVVQDTLKILSTATSYTSMLMLSQDDQTASKLQLLQLLLVEPGKALMVIVTEGDKIENRFISIPSAMTKEDLDLVSMMLNQNLRGLPVDGWQRSMLENIFHDLTHQRKVVDAALEMLSSILKTEKSSKVYLNGTLNMLNQPEFKDVARVKTILQTLEKREVLSQLLTSENKPGVSVKIGSENDIPEVQDCSIVIATYKLKGDTIGKIGLLGPTRMAYSSAVALLDVLAQDLTQRAGED